MDENMQALSKKLMKVTQQVQAHRQLHGEATLVEIVTVGLEALNKNKLMLVREITGVWPIGVSDKTRIQVEMSFEILDVGTLCALKGHWFGDSALNISDAARNAEISYLRHLFGCVIFEPVSVQQPQPAKTNGQKSPVNTNDYKTRKGDFYTVLSKQLAALKMPATAKYMDTLVKLLEDDGTLKPDTEYKQAAALIIERVKTFEAAK